MSTLRVSLADAPTDVLVHLVDHGPANVAELAHLAPEGTVSPASTVSYAVDLLRRIGYVRAFDDHYRWAATDDGAQAVREARRVAPTPEPTCEHGQTVPHDYQAPPPITGADIWRCAGPGGADPKETRE